MKKSVFSTLKTKKMEWIYLICGLFFILLVSGIIFCGCSVVKTDFSPNSKKEATVYYYLPESIIKIKAIAKVAVTYNADSSLTNSNKILEESFVVTVEPIADTKDLLSLNYKANALAADDIKYSVNSKGLLESINIITEDRTANIISQLAQAPQGIFSTSSTGTRSANTIVKIKEFSADFAIKASTISATPDTIKWNIIVSNELGVNELPQTISADFKISSPEIVVTAPTLTELINTPKIYEIDGILTRPLKNITLKFESAIQGGNFNTSLPLNIVVVDITRLIIIPVKRTAFVKRTNNIVIQDGIILKNEITNPSSVEGFVTIPINIAKAIVSIPGQLVQFRYDNTKRLDDLEKVKLDYEKSIQASQNYNSTKELEFEKVKLELQKSLLEAETNRLEAQKTLDTLKKELEKLKKTK